MIKSELVQQLAAKNPHLFQRDLEKIVNVVLDEIIDAMARGDRVELRGFGAFTVKHRPPRQGRNPRTGMQVSVDEKFVPFFKTGKELRERLNPGEAGAGRAKPGKSAAKSTNGSASKSAPSKSAPSKSAPSKSAPRAKAKAAAKTAAKAGAPSRRGNGRSAEPHI